MSVLWSFGRIDCDGPTDDHQPDDWHLHLRDGEHMAAVLGDTARRFARAIVMPNLKPPVTTTELALAYRARILGALPPGSAFQPLMTLYLTDHTRVRRSNEPRPAAPSRRSSTIPQGRPPIRILA